ncbi:MAG: hypothetical protein EOO89_33405 [Pedobacter sp.]|nr:MAG: hypothetical protein EOO89_33405 [Pedobacter sp.]
MPFLAFSEESRFNPDITNMPFGIKDWLENTKLKIKDVKKKNVNPDSVVIKEWRKYLSGGLNLPNKGGRVSSTSCYEWYQYGQFMYQNTSTVREPLLTTEWGQRGISSGALTWGSKNCDGCNRFVVWEYYRPDLSRPRTSNYSCTVSTTGESSLASLMHACGIAASSSYNYFGSCNTFTWPNDVRSGSVIWVFRMEAIRVLLIITKPLKWNF